MTFFLGMLAGILVTVGASLVIASDIDKDNNQF
jgi:hypothetical protein